MLDEKALRKPGFSEGYAVVLADGQEYVFPKPRLRFRPKVDADGRVEIVGGSSFGPEFDGKMDVLFGVGDVEAIEQLRMKFEVAVRLLSTNYELTSDELGDLLVLEPGDAASDERWDQLSRVMMGITPKPLPAT